jgi:membrane-associated phospholipid phosphatase
MIWTRITDLGDAAVMLPAGIVIAAWLLLSRAWQGALLWLSLFGAGAILVVCTKIAYLGWGMGRQLDFTGISGHAMTATSVLAVAGYFVGSKLSRSGAIVATALGYCAGVLVGISRIVVGAHSASEVVAGCALGGLIALMAVTGIRANPKLVVAPLVLAVTLLTLELAVHGEQVPSEQLITKVALYLSGHSAATIPTIRRRGHNP